MRSRRLSPEEKERRAATRQRRSGYERNRDASHSVHLRLTEEQYQVMNAYADREGLSFAEAVREAIQDHIEIMRDAEAEATA